MTGLSRRALNRALLARHDLLERASTTPADALERLVGLQAQAPLPPYYALWSRVADFDADALGRLLTERRAVRITLMRGTIHFVTVADAAFLRPLVQPAIERGFLSAWRKRLGAAEPAAIAAAVREELAAGEPLTARELGTRLVARGIGDDVEAIGNATRVYVPLVQVPPRGVWGKGGQARYATFEAWTGRGLDDDPPPATLVRRYLRAFGPATAADLQNWSGLQRLGEVFEGLRGELVTLRDEDGRELFDVPGALRPDEAAAAPVRLLGHFDNVLLGHENRRRIIPEGAHWGGGPDARRACPNQLVDGMLRALWWIERDGGLVVRPFGSLTSSERDEVVAEAERMLAFSGAPGGAVRFAEGG